MNEYTSYSIKEYNDVTAKKQLVIALFEFEQNPSASLA